VCRSYSDINFGVTFFGTQCILYVLLTKTYRHGLLPPYLLDARQLVPDVNHHLLSPCTFTLELKENECINECVKGLIMIKKINAVKNVNAVP